MLSFFWLAVLVEGGLAVVAILADVLLFGLHFWQYIWCDGETLWQITWGLLPLIAGYFALQALPFAALRRVDRLVRELFQQHMSHLNLWQLAVIAALSGIGEELFFRGLIQLGLSAGLGLHVWLAILIASLIFGLAHAATWTYFLLAFVISIYFGFLLDHTGNLLVPIAIHALYNFAVFLYIRSTPNKLLETTPLPESVLPKDWETEEESNSVDPRH
jgi:hypothetical protein